MAITDNDKELTSNEHAGHPSPFVSSKQIVITDADRALAALFEAIASAGRTIDGRAFNRFCCLAEEAARAFGSRRDIVGRALVERTSAIDLAAALVECADELHREGCFLEGFAVEGIEGRLVESLLGSGPASEG